MNRIYIAGKISGESVEAYREKFLNAETQLYKRGYRDIENPVNFISDPEMPWQDAMRICISRLVFCDAIYLLQDWILSKGARLELEIARKLKLRIIHE